MSLLKFLFTLLVFLLIIATVIRFPFLSIYGFIIFASILLVGDLISTKEY